MDRWLNILGKALGPVKAAFKSMTTTGVPHLLLPAVFVVGFGLGLVGLAFFSDRYTTTRSSASTTAVMIATGIGFHNFSEGLAIDQSAATGAISLAVTLIVGFAFHNITEGFGVAAYGPRPMARELHNEDVWGQCGFTRPPARRTLDRFITDFALVAEDVFITLVHELAEQVPLGKLYRIDGTDIPADHQDDDDAQWNYDHAEDDFYYGYGCCLVTAADNIPVAATFTPTKKVDQETAMRVTREQRSGRQNG